jgi:hypothetical protein
VFNVVVRALKKNPLLVILFDVLDCRFLAETSLFASHSTALDLVTQNPFGSECIDSFLDFTCSLSVPLLAEQFADSLTGTEGCIKLCAYRPFNVFDSK